MQAEASQIVLATWWKILKPVLGVYKLWDLIHVNTALDKDFRRFPPVLATSFVFFPLNLPGFCLSSRRPQRPSLLQPFVQLGALLQFQRCLFAILYAKLSNFFFQLVRRSLNGHSRAVESEGKEDGFTFHHVVTSGELGFRRARCGPGDLSVHVRVKRAEEFFLSACVYSFGASISKVLFSFHRCCIFNSIPEGDRRSLHIKAGRQHRPKLRPLHWTQQQ